MARIVQGVNSTVDLTGSTAGVGPDGVYDDVLTLTGLDTTMQLAGVQVTDVTDVTTGGIWGYGIDPTTVNGSQGQLTGAGSLYISRSGDSSTATLYVNPTTILVNPTNESSGNAQSLPSTPGTYYTFSDGDNLTVSLVYLNAVPLYSVVTLQTSIPTSGSGSQLQPLTPYYLDTYSTSINPNTDIPYGWSQYDTGNPLNNTGNWGWVQFTVPNITSTQLSGAVFTLTDEAGYQWSNQPSTDNTAFSGPLVATENSGGTSALVTFPPIRNENGSKMTLTMSGTGLTVMVNNQPVQEPFTETFTGGESDPRLTVPSIATSSTTVPTPTGNAATDLQNLNAALANGGTVILTQGTAPNIAYTINQPIQITKPVKIISGSGGSAILNFVTTNVVAPNLWSDAIQIQSDNVTLNGFTIEFDNNSSGNLNAWNYGGQFTPAVIGTLPPNDNLNYYNSAGQPIPIANLPVARDYYVGIGLTNMTLDGPFANDPSPMPTNRNQLPGNGGLDQMFYNGSTQILLYNSVYLTGLQDVVDGVVSNNTLTGGSVVFSRGPWQITSNTVNGAQPDTVSQAAFDNVTESYDLLLQNNIVQQVAPNGRVYRFFAQTSGGEYTYNDVINGNSVSGNVGILPGDEGLAFPPDGTFNYYNGTTAPLPPAVVNYYLGRDPQRSRNGSERRLRHPL